MRMASSCMLREPCKYDMSHSKPGKAIIFNLYTESEGGPTDVENLGHTFGSYYGFEVDVHISNTYNEIYKILSIAASQDYTDYNCIMVIILAHGNNIGICASDQTFKTSELWVPFTTCTSLIGKPKIFLIQACRGDMKDLGVQIDSSSNFVIVPCMADILAIYSSFEGYVSYITSDGTPFIKEFCKELMKEDNVGLEFCHIITFVINTIAHTYVFSKDGKEITKQIPTYTSSLTKAFYLTPKRT